MSPPASAIFRPPLAVASSSALLLALAAYAVLLVATDPGQGWVGDYPFGVAAIAGIGLFLFNVNGSYRHRGLRVDGDGIRDMGGAVALRWPEITAVEVKTAASQKSGVLLRYVSVRAGAGEINFADFAGFAPSQAGLIFNTSQAPLLLAAVAARSGAKGLFPASWHDADQSEGDQGAAQVEITPAAALSETAATLSQQARHSGGIIAMIFKLAPKFFKLALKLLKTVKPGAAAVTIGAYALIFSWQFAFILVGMILLHECGHVYAMWRAGVPVKGIYFVPFVGGVAVSQGVAKTRWNNALIAIAGPVWGGVLALACYALFLLSGQSLPLLGATAAWGALLNLFNLLPILPLDGGRILSNIAYSAPRGVGIAVTFATLLFGGALAYVARLELLVLMVIIGLFEFAGQLSAAPVRGALQLLRQRPLGAAEHAHLATFVTPRISGSRAESAARERARRWQQQRNEATQEAMPAARIVLMLLGYAALAAVLLALLWLLKDLPAAGAPLHFLE